MARGIEVVFFDDAVDEFWTSVVQEFEGTKLLSVTRGDIDLSKFASDKAEEKDKKNPEMEAKIASLTGAFKLALGENVKDVRVSDRLTDSPVCLVADEGGMDVHLERLLKQQNQIQEISKRVLEINPGNDLIKALAEIAVERPSDPTLIEAAELLLDQAKIIEGDVISDPAAFAKRLTAMMSKSIGKS